MLRGSSLCRLRLLYSAENREFVLERISPSQTIVSIKQQIVDAWPSDLSPAKRPADTSAIRLLFAGHFLEDTIRLGELPLIAIGGTSTFHVILIAPLGKPRGASGKHAHGSAGARKPAPASSAAAGHEGGRGDDRRDRCGPQCAIS